MDPAACDQPAAFCLLPPDVILTIAQLLLEDLTAGATALARLCCCCHALFTLQHAQALQRLVATRTETLGAPLSHTLEQLAVLEVGAGLGARCVFFERGGTELRPGSSRARLDAFAALLIHHPCLLVEIDGHAAPNMPPSVAEQVSIARAAAVARALVERGVCAGRISGRGWAGNVAAAAGWPNGSHESRRADLHFALDGVALPPRREWYEGKWYEGVEPS
mmetsp:Transcript_7929/g.17395  ORF Transcript_7929/g.17395 Transcript_7929/m.17395 type:complete len:221 (-) Transcript_7929:256-918(-)